MNVTFCLNKNSVISERLAFWLKNMFRRYILKIMFRKYMFRGTIIEKDKENLGSGCQGLGLLSSALDSENSLRVKFRSLVCGFWAIVINIDYLSRQGINCLSVKKMFLDITKSRSVHMEQKDNSWTVVCYYGWKTLFLKDFYMRGTS